MKWISDNMNTGIRMIATQKSAAHGYCNPCWLAFEYGLLFEEVKLLHSIILVVITNPLKPDHFEPGFIGVLPRITGRKVVDKWWWLLSVFKGKLEGVSLQFFVGYWLLARIGKDGTIYSDIYKILRIC